MTFKCAVKDGWTMVFGGDYIMILDSWMGCNRNTIAKYINDNNLNNNKSKLVSFSQKAEARCI